MVTYYNNGINFALRNKNITCYLCSTSVQNLDTVSCEKEFEISVDNFQIQQVDTKHLAL
jgi:hypothetical protein